MPALVLLEIRIQTIQVQVLWKCEFSSRSTFYPSSICCVLIALSQTFALFHMLSSNNRMTSFLIEVWRLRQRRQEFIFRIHHAPYIVQIEAAGCCWKTHSFSFNTVSRVQYQHVCSAFEVYWINGVQKGVHWRIGLCGKLKSNLFDITHWERFVVKFVSLTL